MKLVYTGKTKNVFELENGNYLLKFKDDATGANGVFDPGANTVGVTIKGLGLSGIKLTTFFYKKLTELGIDNHFVSSNLETGEMEVKPAKPFGKGLEVICRLKAVGSFLRRFGDYCTDGQDLNYFVETTLKDDKREDPPITKDALEMLNIITADEYEALKKETIKITKIVKKLLAEREITLYDIKFEFGINNGKVILIDEITGGNMRATYKGKFLKPLEFEPIILAGK